MTKTKVQAYAAQSATSALAPFGIKQDARYRFVISMASLKS